MMREKHTTIRVHMNPKDAVGTLGHTLDKNFRNKESHVLEDGEFEIFVNKGVYDTYKEIFGDVLEAYNSKQKRKDRKIVDAHGDAVAGYIEQLMTAKRGKRTSKVEKTLKDGQKVTIGEKESNGTRLLYEFIFSAGNCNKAFDDRGQVIFDDDGKEVQPWRMPAVVSKRTLKRFSDEFESKYKNLKICYSVYHADEFYYNERGQQEMGIEHMHIGVVPFGDGYQRGLSVQQSMRRALDLMKYKNGIGDDGVYHTAYWYLCDAMQKDFEEILQQEYTKWLEENGKPAELLIVDHLARGKNLPNLSPRDYRAMKELEAKQRSMVGVYEDIEDALQEAEEVDYERHIEEERYRKDIEEYKQLIDQSREANASIFNTFVDDMERLRQTVTDTDSKVEEYKKRVDKMPVNLSINVDVNDMHLLAWMKAQKTRRGGREMSYLDAYKHDLGYAAHKKTKARLNQQVQEVEDVGTNLFNEITLKEEEARRRQREAEMLSRINFDANEEDEEMER